MNSETKLNNKIIDLKKFAKMQDKIDKKVNTLKIDKDVFINDFFKKIYSVSLEKKNENLSATDFQKIIDKIWKSKYKWNNFLEKLKNYLSAYKTKTQSNNSDPFIDAYHDKLEEILERKEGYEKFFEKYNEFIAKFEKNRNLKKMDNFISYVKEPNIFLYNVSKHMNCDIKWYINWDIKKEDLNFTLIEKLPWWDSIKSIIDYVDAYKKLNNDTKWNINNLLESLTTSFKSNTFIKEIVNLKKLNTNSNNTLDIDLLWYYGASNLDKIDVNKNDVDAIINWKKKVEDMKSDEIFKYAKINLESFFALLSYLKGKKLLNLNTTQKENLINFFVSVTQFTISKRASFQKTGMNMKTDQQNLLNNNTYLIINNTSYLKDTIYDKQELEKLQEKKSYSDKINVYFRMLKTKGIKNKRDFHEFQSAAKDLLTGKNGNKLEEIKKESPQNYKIILFYLKLAKESSTFNEYKNKLEKKQRILKTWDLFTDWMKIKGEYSEYSNKIEKIRDCLFFGEEKPCHDSDIMTDLFTFLNSVFNKLFFNANRDYMIKNMDNYISSWYNIRAYLEEIISNKKIQNELDTGYKDLYITMFKKATDASVLSFTSDKELKKRAISWWVATKAIQLQLWQLSWEKTPYVSNHIDINSISITDSEISYKSLVNGKKNIEEIWEDLWKAFDAVDTKHDEDKIKDNLQKYAPSLYSIYKKQDGSLDLESMKEDYKKLLFLYEKAQSDSSIVMSPELLDKLVDYTFVFFDKENDSVPNLIKDLNETINLEQINTQFDKLKEKDDIDDNNDAYDKACKTVKNYWGFIHKIQREALYKILLGGTENLEHPSDMLINALLKKYIYRWLKSDTVNTMFVKDASKNSNIKSIFGDEFKITLWDNIGFMLKKLTPDILTILVAELVGSALDLTGVGAEAWVALNAWGGTRFARLAYRGYDMFKVWDEGWMMLDWASFLWRQWVTSWTYTLLRWWNWWHNFLMFAAADGVWWLWGKMVEKIGGIGAKEWGEVLWTSSKVLSKPLALAWTLTLWVWSMAWISYLEWEKVDLSTIWYDALFMLILSGAWKIVEPVWWKIQEFWINKTAKLWENPLLGEKSIMTNESWDSVKVDVKDAWIVKNFGEKSRLSSHQDQPYIRTDNEIFLWKRWNNWIIFNENIDISNLNLTPDARLIYKNNGTYVFKDGTNIIFSWDKPSWWIKEIKSGDIQKLWPKIKSDKFDLGNRQKIHQNEAFSFDIKELFNAKDADWNLDLTVFENVDKILEARFWSDYEAFLKKKWLFSSKYKTFFESIQKEPKIKKSLKKITDDVSTWKYDEKIKDTDLYKSVKSKLKKSGEKLEEIDLKKKALNITKNILLLPLKLTWWLAKKWVKAWWILLLLWAWWLWIDYSWDHHLDTLDWAKKHWKWIAATTGTYVFHSQIQSALEKIWLTKIPLVWKLIKSKVFSSLLAWYAVNKITK